MDTVSSEMPVMAGEVSGQNRPVIGYWTADGTNPVSDSAAMKAAVQRIHSPLTIVSNEGRVGLAEGGRVTLGKGATPEGNPVIGLVPACDPQVLGDPTFCRDHGIRYPYVAGAMANGIGSVEVVEAMGRAGMLGFFGSAGLAPERVEAAIEHLSGSLGDTPFGFNLIHSPNESDTEAAVVDLYIKYKIRLVEASAYLGLTLPIVRYRLHGIHRDANGRVVTPNKVIAKVSRVEVATRFFSPPPAKLLKKLLESGDITPEQAEMALEIPMAQDLTAEADSGGHTDKRPAIALLPTLCALRDQLQQEHGYGMNLRVGLGGGIATPQSAAAAFAMGAAYIVTGSINQACVESGTCDAVRQMLAEARQADVAMAPAADMFEMGVTVQVLKRGTMFPMRASKLYELYRSCESMDAIPAAEKEKLETTVFRAPLETIWEQTRAFFEQRDPRQIRRAEENPKHKMALVFRWYLGQSSNWANRGVEDRTMDYQVWCGPAMGAFNEWTKGTFLEQAVNRKVATVGLNVLRGAAVMNRINALRTAGVAVPSEMAAIEPLEENVLHEAMGTR